MYFVRPTVANAQLIAAQVKDLNRCAENACCSIPAAAAPQAPISAGRPSLASQWCSICWRMLAGRIAQFFCEQLRFKRHVVAFSIEASYLGGSFARRGDAKHDVSVFFIPQRSLLCERLLKAEGVWGDLAIADIPVHWTPYDTDVLSLELDGVFKVRHHYCQIRLSVRPTGMHVGFVIVVSVFDVARAHLQKTHLQELHARRNVPI